MIIYQNFTQKIFYKKFLQTNQSELFKNMIQEFSKIIPVDEQRLSTSGIWKNEAKGAIELSSRTIFDDLSTLIKKKGFRALSNNEYTSLIESASFIMTRDHIKEFYPLIIIFIIFIVNLIILYFLARWKNPEGRNIAIFETALIMQRFWCGVVKNTPHLIGVELKILHI
ncbi:hypothetical protein GLOIN_2v366506 [Rhizophagus irregularis DAOM 181602=DAOM 197198]|uniref:Uncharacterized protein n=2 Tax=Rhizophagus irregularis (strain DAOM 181602 / DAOM 197198 / MUCL 43194) TaxID=747089 RepID=A0A2P4PLQ4_RHIID|nr:hypothetical protein GLOIN_2v366506 [Rhizophagus irregularis DAOM 181602=DAOM 197198]POG66305.1 hypothetical protein GLOIN_2v366506 [Rhizophagus irregularis DAOM 181602=DAOM 197198]|eukprot:XP_025173171.1 hypothetical protein GLOIN_2v366506 [Rhizophagus irregularis DAOM 181602=DAOM 197198]